MITPLLPVAPGQALFIAPLLGLSTLAPAMLVPHSPLVAWISVASGTGLAMLGARSWLIASAGAMLAWAAYRAASGFDPYLWSGLAALVIAALVAKRGRTITLALSLDVWATIIAVGSLSMALALALPGPSGVAAGLLAMLCIALASFAIARQLIPFDGRAMASSKDVALAQLTRHLLLGRITSGLLHDLSQPLNVISMANGNLDYIIDRLDLNEEQRSQLLERTHRIATNTDRAAQILSLFRWFGRDGSRDRGLLTIGSALDRAVTVVKADLNLGDIDVAVRGDALDYPVLLRHGTVEMLAVGALLGACRSLVTSGDGPPTGSIAIDAGQTERDIVVTIRCEVTAGMACSNDVDEAMMWLVAKVAREGGGDFRQVNGRDQPLCFVIRFAREII